MANSRMHWRVKNRKRKAYFEMCDLTTFQGWRGSTPKRVKIKATVYCGGRMDDDNAIARLKWPVDWMVRNGWLEDDRSSQLEWDWPIAQVVKRGQGYHVDFELTETV